MYLRLRGLKVLERKAKLVVCDIHNEIKLIIGDDVILDGFQNNSGWCNDYGWRYRYSYELGSSDVNDYKKLQKLTLSRRLQLNNPHNPNIRLPYLSHKRI